MTRNIEIFLTVLRSAVCGETLSNVPDLSTEQWEDVFRLALEHELLPLVFDTVYGLTSVKKLEREKYKDYREKSLQLAVRQIIQTNEFLTLLLHAQEKGLDPVVIKGVVCRSLYPKPMLRPSVDEDILVPASQVKAFHDFFLQEGLFSDDPDADLNTATELSYHKENSPTYIEMHTEPFPSDSDAYGDLNALFDGALNRTVRVQIEDVSVRTLAPTDHLLYMLCHAYKHFLHGGIGIRQVCDIGMITKRYKTEIDWPDVFSKCKEIRIDRFAAAIFKIGEKYLGFSSPDIFASVNTDEQHLLDDILSGGNFGLSDVDRIHSSTITLEAVGSQRKGKKSRGFFSAAFPKRKSLEGRYPYLREKPWLLPVAWGQRITGYLLNRKAGIKGNPCRSLKIGRERTDLLKEYGIID